MELEGIKIPEAWVALLVEVQKEDPEAMIAGGAIRDLAFGKSISDIDIFTRVLPPWADDFGPPAIDYEGMKYVDVVVSIQREGIDPINIIRHEPCTNIEMLSTFDYGFCQIGFDGKQLLKTPEYLWDFKHGVITLRHTERYQRSIRRYAKWINRYDLPIVIPALEQKELF